MTNSGKVARRCVGPGPAAYMLPSLTGYQGHDFSRYRNPAYTFKRKSGRSQKTLGPGPVYNIEHMTEYGKAHPPAYSIVSRRIPKVSHLDSGFGNPTYREGPNPPAYSIRGKGKSMRTSDNYPGPQKYSLPTVLGCHVPDKFSAPCYSM